MMGDGFMQNCRLLTELSMSSFEMLTHKFNLGDSYLPEG